MKYPLGFAVGVWLICSAFLFAQGNLSSTGQNEPPASNSNNIQPGPPNPENKDGPIDILSDTKGVDVHAYLDRVVPKIRANWYIRARSARLLKKKGKVLIGLRVMKDGKIADVKYHENSGDIALDRAAYDGITDSSPLPPLPSGFPCQYIELRFRFYYNPDKWDAVHKKATPTVPCVTTTIGLIGAVEVTISPSSAQVATGAKQQFLAAVTGDIDSVVTWSVRGSGCEAPTCGIISADGLYTAPTKILSPGTITVTGTLGAIPTESASATVTIVQSGASR